MSTVQKSLRMPESLAQVITAAAEATGRDFTAMATELLSEAITMRRCPGIAFMDGATGRRAIIAGTGIDVWEVAYVYEHANRDFGELCQAFSHLTEPQLRAALGYAVLYPDEVRRRIAENEAWTPERLARELPIFVPPRP
jgi:uncharacterized protein (DUF433 family)